MCYSSCIPGSDSFPITSWMRSGYFYLDKPLSRKVNMDGEITSFRRYPKPTELQKQSALRKIARFVFKAFYVLSCVWLLLGAIDLARLLIYKIRKPSLTHEEKRYVSELAKVIKKGGAKEVCSIEWLKNLQINAKNLSCLVDYSPPAIFRFLMLARISLDGIEEFTRENPMLKEYIDIFQGKKQDSKPALTATLEVTGGKGENSIIDPVCKQLEKYSEVEIQGILETSFAELKRKVAPAEDLKTFSEVKRAILAHVVICNAETSQHSLIDLQGTALSNLFKSFMVPKSISSLTNKFVRDFLPRTGPIKPQTKGGWVGFSCDNQILSILLRCDVSRYVVSALPRGTCGSLAANGYVIFPSWENNEVNMIFNVHTFPEGIISKFHIENGEPKISMVVSVNSDVMFAIRNILKVLFKVNLLSKTKHAELLEKYSEHTDYTLRDENGLYHTSFTLDGDKAACFNAIDVSLSA